MKTWLPYLGAIVVGLGAAAALAPAQSPAPAKPANPTIAVANTIAAQQAQIVANQVEIVAKIADIEENVRQARIFAKRGGGGAAE